MHLRLLCGCLFCSLTTPTCGSFPVLPSENRMSRLLPPIRDMSRFAEFPTDQSEKLPGIVKKFVCPTEKSSEELKLPVFGNL